MKSVRPLFLPPPYQDSVEGGRLILRDGATAAIRLACPSDAPAVQEFFRRLSPQSRVMRFFTPAKPGEDVISAMCDSSDPGRQATFLVLRRIGERERVVAAASYFRKDDTAAEFAVAVDDEFQGRGLGQLTLERLAVLAAGHGFRRFDAVTHATNRPMLEVFHHSGFPVRERLEDGCVEISFSVEPREESVARSALRDRVFTKASLRAVFQPRSVAVVGASRDPAGFGRRILEGLIAGGYQGPVFPVNPQASVVCSMKAHPSVRALPELVDLAVIAVARDRVPEVVDDCAARGVRAVIVISAGYAETGPEGLRLQRALAEQVRGHGMRLVGPNCLGVINTDPAVRLNASFARDFPQAGRIAVSSQSGALGLAILSLARVRNLGLSMFISMGNKADVTGNDLLLYWEDDPHTDVIVLYLESFGNPRRFARIARDVSRRKPIVCVKGGRDRSASGGGQDATVSALFRQTGVIRAETFEEMFDVAALLGNQPLPKGRRVAILTNSHGSGVLCRDACAAAGLEASALSEAAWAGLAPALPAGASAGTVVDLTADAGPDHYRGALEAALRDEEVHAVIVLYVPLDLGGGAAVVPALHEGLAAGRAAGGRDRPVLVVMMTPEGNRGLLPGPAENLPLYLFPEAAARALGEAADYGAWRARPPGTLVDFDDMDPARGQAVCRRVLAAAGPGWLSEADAAALLEAFGLSAAGAPPASAAVAPVLIRVTEDPLFGPVVQFGLSGVHADVFRDLSVRVTPLTDADAADMIREIRGFALLARAPGGGAADVDALAELLLRISLMIEEVPEIREMEFQPVHVLAAGQGCRVERARFRVAPPGADQPARYTTAAF